MVPMPSSELACGASAWETAAQALPHPAHREAVWLVVDWGVGFWRVVGGSARVLARVGDQDVMTVPGACGF